MFIRKVPHTNKKNRQKYHTYKLIESIRTERGPRHRTVLNLGVDFSFPQDQWKELANRIEAIISRQNPLFPVPQEIEATAQNISQKIIREQGTTQPEPRGCEEEPEYETVDIKSVESEQIRTVGGERTVLAAIKELELDKKFEELEFKKADIEAAIGVISARLLAPGSERQAHLWLKNKTGLGDLMNTSFDSLSQDRVYKVSDRLLKNKSIIEAHLRDREANLFNLDEKILLYDLTNTFFEGSGRYNAKAHFGVSKEKRKDCPLVTLAMVMDSAGFPKRSQVFEGNVSEPATLEKMIHSLAGDKQRPMVVTDAGIGTQENLDRLVASGYDYLTVSRKRKRDMPSIEDMVTVRENDQRLIKAALRINETGEMQVYCHSSAREITEKGIKTRFEKRFEEQLQKVQNGLGRKHGTKKYEKVLEKIGRLKEKYRRAANRYDINVEKDDKTGYALKIDWLKKEINDTSGYYVLRTNRTDLDEKQVFDTFTMLLDLEDAFRSMKSELGLRPVHHQIEFRCDGHLFITVIGYHVLQTIRVKLRSKGITNSWRTIRDLLSTHYQVTTSMKRMDGKMLYIRKCSKPEECHIKIYDALNLPHRPGVIRKTVI